MISQIFKTSEIQNFFLVRFLQKFYALDRKFEGSLGVLEILKSNLGRHVGKINKKVVRMIFKDLGSQS